MEGSVSWAKSKSAGDTAETLVIGLFQSLKTVVAERNLDRLVKWDVKVQYPTDTFLFEIKHDLYHARSGNLAIEFHNNKSGKPSGLEITDADIWIHVLPDPLVIWATSVANLKIFTKTTVPLKTITGAGDGNACLHIYQDSIILPAIFTRIDNLEPKKLKTCLKKLLAEKLPRIQT